MNGVRDTTVQPLNALDIALRCVDQSIRGMGYPGFQTQMLVWLAGRVDVDVLRRAVEHLGRRRPVVTARLIEAHDGPPHWRFRSGARADLEVVELESNERSAVLKTAGEMLSAARDPAGHDPLRFHLLRQPRGDVLVVQYSHVLMDNGATAVLLRELNEPADCGGDPLRPEPRNVVGRYLRQVPRARRQAASQAAIQLQGHVLRGRAALVSTGEEDRPRRVALQLATRSLEADQAQALRTRVIGLCGLPNLSMAILAGALRSVRALGPAHLNGDRKYTAGIGLDLNLRSNSGALLQNLLSVVPLSVSASDLADCGELVRVLSRQMRDRLQSRIDLGALRLAHAFQRRPRHVRWVVEHLLRWTYSLWYAYFGSQGAAEKLCGTAIDEISYFGPTWSPLGIALLANQYDGRLHLNLTYDPELVRPTLAEEFLSRVLLELRELNGTLHAGSA